MRYWVFIVLVLCATSVFAVSANQGNNAPSTGCTDGAEVPGGVHRSCTVWGPVEWNNPESYLTVDPPVKGCSDSSKVVCGCLNTGQVTVSLPNDDAGIAVHVANMNIPGMVSGSKQVMTLYAGDVGASNEVARQENAAEPAPPKMTPHPLTLRAGDNLFTFTNTKDKISVRSCFQMTYEYDFIEDGDYNDTLCQTHQGNDWLEGTVGDADLGKRCCGDDPEPGQDFFMQVPVTIEGKQTMAACVRTWMGAGDASAGWKWISANNPGDVQILDYSQGGFNYAGDATIVYTSAGPRLCAARPAGTSGPGGPPAMLTAEVARALNPQTGAPITLLDGAAAMHGYTCTKLQTGWLAAECAGDDPAFSKGEVGNKLVYKTYDAVEPVHLPQSRMYCTANGTWLDDIDKDPLMCGQVSGPDGRQFVWTGSYCCGDDAKEYYNDPSPIRQEGNRWMFSDGNPAGCWNSSVVWGIGPENDENHRLAYDVAPSDPLLAGLNNRSVINFNGTFFGCNLPANTPVLAKRWCVAKRECVEDGAKVRITDGLCGVADIGCRYGCAGGKCTDSPPTCQGGKLYVFDGETGQKKEPAAKDCGSAGCADGATACNAPPAQQGTTEFVAYEGYAAVGSCSALLRGAPPGVTKGRFPSDQKDVKCYYTSGAKKGQQKPVASCIKARGVKQDVPADADCDKKNSRGACMSTDKQAKACARWLNGSLEGRNDFATEVLAQFNGPDVCKCGAVITTQHTGINRNVFGFKINCYNLKAGVTDVALCDKANAEDKTVQIGPPQRRR